jgi:hypothetical protein
LELSSVCIVDVTGKVVKETKVETHPEALVKFFKGLPLTRIGLEAGPLSHWLYAGLTEEAGFETTLMETRHVKAALSAVTVKTDARTHAAWLSCCAWVGSGRYMPCHRDRRRCARSWSRASSSNTSSPTSSSASAAFSEVSA